MIIKNNNRILLNKGVIVNKFSLDDMTIAFISGLTTQPSTAQIKLIDIFIKQTKSILLKADVVYLGNINNTSDSFRNLVKDAHHGTIVGNTLEYDEYWGWSNPNADSYINTNYNPATQGVNYQQNSAYVGVYKFGNNTDSYNNSMIIGQVSNCSMYLYYNINNGTSDGKGTLPFDNGLHSMRRLSSTQSNFLNRNIPNTVSNYNSVAPHNSNFFIFTNYVGSPIPYNKGLSFVYIGGGLDDNEHKQLNDAVNDYLIQCLFLKYGLNNWGVKMAKSYFLELHNFERYEAFEVYEFIKRHQPDYKEINLIPSDSSTFDTSGGTTWWMVSSGTISYNSVDKCLQLNSTATGFIYKSSVTLFNNYAIGYRVRFKYRSSTYTNSLKVYFGSLINSTTNNCTTDWQQYDNYIIGSGAGTAFYIQLNVSFVGTVELDDIEIIPEGYLYKQFSGSTIADYIMMFKAGGNLIAATSIKSGVILRWSQDGIVYNNNTLQSYTRGSNLGIVTVTSTDGWNSVTRLQLQQTTASVNSFYGNMPRFLGTLKTSGSKLELYWRNNRMKIDLINQPLSTLSSYIYLLQSNTGYNKLNISDLIGGTYTFIYAMGDLYNTGGKISGDVTQFTTEINGSIYLRNDKSIYGSLKNFITNNSTQAIYFDRTSVTEGLSNWNKNISAYLFTDCYFTTQEVDYQLNMINTYFTTNTPIKNLSIGFGGATMGIPTGGANNTDLLGIIAKHTAAGFTATIGVRTV